MRFFIAGCLAIVFFGSCQFTETLILEEDGSGQIEILMNMDELMAFSTGMDKDTTEIKMDTVYTIRTMLASKKDSIAKLPKAEQDRLKQLSNYSIRAKMNSNEGLMRVRVFTDFKRIGEANDLLEGFTQAGDVLNVLEKGEKKDNKVENTSSNTIGVKYNYAKNVFSRDAYIKDPKAHKKETDSLKETESFLKGMKYTLRYTFPRKIKTTSNPDATFLQDGKTLLLTVPMLEYFKNPDVLDLEVVLEN